MVNLTICLISSGEETEQESRISIAPFIENGCILQTVSNVFPQIKALNLMLEQCETEWLIPVDADMLLEPDAYPRIKNAISRHRIDTSWHSILFPLWDTLTQKKILALKVLRTEMMKENIFKESLTPDVEHYKRLTDKGYTCIHDYLKQKTIGNHVIKGKHYCYFKFRDVYQTYKFYNFEWDNGVFMGGNDLRSRAKAHFDYFIHQWLVTENNDYLHCIAGMMDGILSETENKSKTLENKKYKIKSKGAVHHFINWYMSPIYENLSSSYIF